MKCPCLTALTVFGVLAWSAGDSRCGDWPQYRYDAARSAGSPEQLPESLNLEWVRRMPAPRPAFASEVRLRFDATYEPVVMGGTVFVPSMVDDSLTALDAETGAERWRFFAEGPVRFAPVAWEGGVYFISDDGYLYCLDAASGILRWKFRELPTGKTDRKVLGGGRLITLWPARGGPALHNGVVYFGAGLWNTYGVSVHAVDAKSGKPVWSNTDSNHIAKANMDHGVAHYVGLTPQGYLAVLGERLVVPCGAQLPAFLNLKSGALETYSMGWGGREGLPKGTWFVAGDGKYLSHGGDLFDLTRANDERLDDPRAATDFKSMLYPGGWTRVQIDATNQKDLGAFREPVFASGVMYDRDRDVVAYDLSQPTTRQRSKTPVPEVRRTDKYPDKWVTDFRELWRLGSPLKPHIKAGQHLYLGGAGAVEAVRIPDPGQEPRVVWRGTVEGTPERMLAASGKLFVVTREGTLYAFGGQKKAEPTVYDLAAPPVTPPDAWSDTAADILRIAKVSEGYALVLGIGTGRLVEELVRQSKLDVIAIDADAAKVDRLRRRLHAAGLYGPRASVYAGDPLRYPLPPYLASLVVSEDWPGADAAIDRPWVEAVFHPLRPYGGTACLKLAPKQRDALLREATPGQIASANARTSGDWVLLSREGALAGSADWSHAEADAANTGASEDRFLRAPLEMLWFDAPPRWIRTQGSTAVRVCGGRMFIRTGKVQALDVYTGRQLWETTLSASGGPGQVVALDDVLYVTLSTMCVVFNPATGRKIGQIELPDGLTGPWANLRISGEHLVAQSGKHLVCLKRGDGKMAWKSECARPNLSVAVGGGKVFCAELSVKRTGEAGQEDVPLRAFDIETGKVVWQIRGGSEVRYSPAHDLVVLASGVYRAADGRLVAALPEPPEMNPKTKPENLVHPLFIVGPNVLVGTAESFTAYDLLSGRQVGETTAWMRRGCTLPRASANFFVTRYRGNAACVDLATREITSLWNVRAACSNNLFPANGVLSVPNLMGGCTCNYMPVSQACVPAAVIGRGAPER